MVDGDTYIHVAAGRWILHHRQFIHADPFSYTFRGAKWDAPEWLSEVFMAGAYRLAGWSGVCALYATACGFTAFVLARRLLRHLTPIPAILILWLAIACVAGGLSTRPYVLALPILALWTDALLSARDEGRAPHLWLLPLMTLWSNLHASFLFGLVLVVPFAAEAVLEAGSQRARTLRAWGLFLLAAIVASVINPHGIFGLIDPVRFMLRPVLASIGDWGSSLFGKPSPFEVALLAIIAFALLRPMRLSIPRILLLVLVLHMALSQRRHVSVFAVVVPMLLAEPIAIALDGRDDVRAAIRANLRAIPALSAGVAALAILAVRIAVPNARPDDVISPMKALAYVPEAIRSLPVLNSDVNGGFLIWNGVAPFIDTRVELYDDKFQDNRGKLYDLDRRAVSSTLARYRIGWTFLPPKGPLNATLDALPGWRVLYADKNAVVHVRSSATAGPQRATQR